METLYRQIVESLRHIMTHILGPQLDVDEFLTLVANAAKSLAPDLLEARIYEVNFIDNSLYLKTCTLLDVDSLEENDRVFSILPRTITGDAIIENRTIMATSRDGYAASRFVDGEEMRAAFPIEFFDAEMPEGRTRYVLVVDKKGNTPISQEVIRALGDFAALAGLALSIKELRDRLELYYEENRNLAMTGRHSASIGHDIRSMNIGVGGYLSRALRYLSGAPERDDINKIRKYVTLAQDNARHIEGLLKNLTQFNRSEIILNRDTDLVDLLTEQVDSLRNRAEYDQIDFKVTLPDEKTGLLVDQDWFGTVLDNLVKNSLEACRDKVDLMIVLTRTEDAWTLRFEDNCGGISPDILPEVFTPFRTSKSKGQGLGLANVKKVVEDHGGRITVDNREGRGAVFFIEFPLKKGRSAQNRDIKPKGEKPLVTGDHRR